jgi:hypothetical protein
MKTTASAKRKEPTTISKIITFLAKTSSKYSTTKACALKASLRKEAPIRTIRVILIICTAFFTPIVIYALHSIFTLTLLIYVSFNEIKIHVQKKKNQQSCNRFCNHSNKKILHLSLLI